MTIDEWVAANCPEMIDGVDIKTADEALHALLDLMSDSRLRSLRELRSRHKLMERQLAHALRAFELLQEEIKLMAAVNRSMPS